MKANTCICLDVELLIEGRKRKINLSCLINDFLKSYFKIKNNKIGDKDITAAIAEAESKVLELQKRKEKAEKVEKKKYKVMIHNA